LELAILTDELSERIWANSQFRGEYAALVLESITRGVVGLTQPRREDDWRARVRRLLQSATHLAATQEPIYRQAAYRIATAAFGLYGSEYDNIREVVSFILTRLGNFPAVNLLYGGRREGNDTGLPLPLWFEVESREVNNSVRVNGDFQLLTDFQKRLWESLESRMSTAVTAPTSAGKSFALQRFLAKLFLTERGWATYVVPTRALLNQVADGVSELLNSLGIVDSVFTIPVPPHELGVSAGIYVLTQERLQLLLEADPGLAFGLVIIDEAQILGDGGRGVILEVVVEKLRARRSQIQFLFGSPQTRNPQVFQTVFALPRLNVIEEVEAPVAQNILFVDTDPIKLNEAQVSAQFEGERRPLSQLKLPTALYDNDQKLSFMSWLLGRGQKNLVYAGGQARCEVISNHLMQFVRAEGDTSAPDPEISELSAFLKEHIHPQFLMCESILNRVAFHYGNMPPIVRKNIEELFATGALDYLVCTSTLLHGVNLPAKNLFLLDPTKGVDWDSREDIPISSLEFWNLSGRAGRLGKEFAGNVFLIDEGKWQSKPLEGDRLQEIEPATQKTVREKTQEFLEFVKAPAHASGEHAANENTFVKLFVDSRQGKLDQSLDRVFGEAGSSSKQAVRAAIDAAASTISVPLEIVGRNVSVSVYRQQEMLDYLVRGIEENGAPRYTPIHPLRDWDDALPALRFVFKRIHSHFEKKPGRDRSEFYYAPLALRWMRGEPLRRLIDGAYEYRQSRQRTVRIATVIRDVFRDVETDLRFRYVKYTSCYNDLLAEALRRTGYAELTAHIPSIPLFLEIGASSKTMVNLVGLGFSRTAAAIITTTAAEKDMNRETTQGFLRRQNWEALGVSPVIRKEIERLTRREQV